MQHIRSRYGAFIHAIVSTNGIQTVYRPLEVTVAIYNITATQLIIFIIIIIIIFAVVFAADIVVLLTVIYSCGNGIQLGVGRTRQIATTLEKVFAE